jgi:hypothetical protein
VIGVIAYRVSMLAALQIFSQQVQVNNTLGQQAATLVYKNASLFTTVTASLINLFIITLLTFVSRLQLN